MDRFKNLGRYQKSLLILMAVMILVFGIVYSVVTSRTGFLYRNTILVPTVENGATIYSGKILGQNCSFTVTPDRTVTFFYGEKKYGPYIVQEDPTAVPKNHNLSGDMTGIDIRDGKEIFFRGGVLKMGSDEPYWMLFDEDGTISVFSVMVQMSDGSIRDSDGNEVDPLQPSVSAILDLIHGPQLTHKGQWIAWFGGVLFSVLNACSILFAEELFRWNLSFQIRNADRAEPSDWEIAGRYIGWTVLTIAIFVIYIMGLQ